MLILNFPTPKKLIIQLPASNVWKNANHKIFIQLQKTIEKKIQSSFSGYLNQIQQSGDKKQLRLFFLKNLFFSSNQNNLVSNGACFSLLVHSCHPVFLYLNISCSSKYYANGVEILIS